MERGPGGGNLGGLPNVGGNAEVVSSPSLGILVPFDDPAKLQAAIDDALAREWDRKRIMQHAHDNSWDERIALLATHFQAIAQGKPGRAKY